MKWNVSEAEWDWEWAQHDTETQSVKFYIETDWCLTDEQERIISDAMVKAAAVALIGIKEECERNGLHSQS